MEGRGPGSLQGIIPTFPRRTEGNHKPPQSEQQVPRLSSEPGVSEIQVTQDVTYRLTRSTGFLCAPDITQPAFKRALIPCVWLVSRMHVQKATDHKIRGSRSGEMSTALCWFVTPRVRMGNCPQRLSGLTVQKTTTDNRPHFVQFFCQEGTERYRDAYFKL